MTSRLVGHVADRLGDLLLGERVERRGGLVEHQQVRPAQEGARDRQPLLLAAGDLHPALADDRVEALVGPGEQAVARGLPSAPPGTRRRWRRAARRAGSRGSIPEKSCVSWVTKPMRSRRPSRSTRRAGMPVVEDAAGLRPVEAHEQLHERRLARAGRPDEGDGLAALDPEGDPGRGPERRRSRCVKPTSSKARSNSSSRRTGLAGFGSLGVFRMLLRSWRATPRPRGRR